MGTAGCRLVAAAAKMTVKRLMEAASSNIDSTAGDRQKRQRQHLGQKASSNGDSTLETGSSSTDDCEEYDGDCRSATRVKWLLRRRRWRGR
jgi:hypothetical protein